MALPLFNTDTPVINTVMNPIIEKVNENESAIGQNSNKIAQLSNPNLLINGDFQVWQRGTSFTPPAGISYTADRWRFQVGSGASGVVSKITNGLRVQVTSGTLLTRQYIEGNFEGKICTISMKANGEVVKATGLVSVTPILSPKISGDKADCYFLLENNFLVIASNMYSGTIDVEFIKIELGEIATPLSPRPYGEELALCQRYGVPLGTNTSARVTNYSSNVLGFLIPFPTQMRSIASIVGTAKIYNMSALEQTGFTLSIANISANGIMIAATKINHGLTDGFIIFNNGGFLDAEIY